MILHYTPCSHPKRVTAVKVFAWGSGRNGRLGLGTQLPAASPELIEYLDGCDIKDISCGHDHTLVLVRRLAPE